MSYRSTYGGESLATPGGCKQRPSKARQFYESDILARVGVINHRGREHRGSVALAPELLLADRSAVFLRLDRAAPEPLPRLEALEEPPRG